MGKPPVHAAIQFGAPLPDPGSRWIYINSPGVADPRAMICLGHQGTSCLTHWLSDDRLKGGGRTVPHTVPDDTCPLCVERNQRPRWHCYIACWSLKTSRYCLADVTTHAAQVCRALDPASGVDLRGRTLTLSRIGRSSNSPVKAELSEDRVPEEKCPAAFEVVPALTRLWGCHDSHYWRMGNDLNRS
jgi:hypothetical protein